MAAQRDRWPDVGTTLADGVVGTDRGRRSPHSSQVSCFRAGNGTLPSNQGIQGPRENVSACGDAARVWCGPFWKFFLICLLPHHFLEAKINTDIPACVKVTGVYTISVKSYAPKPS